LAGEDVEEVLELTNCRFVAADGWRRADSGPAGDAP
jgi:hypothetical protein